jgi:ubiquinone/menaquinone biosynthesis C-methylase UbiE
MNQLLDNETRLQRVQHDYHVFGRHPGLYAAQDWITFLGRPGTIRRLAVEALRVGPGSRVLEVACGTGRNFPYLQEAIGSNGELVGLDYTPEMLASARRLVERKGWRNVTLLQGDAARLEVGEAPFDGILCSLAMSVIPDYRGALRRCREVLRPGGILVVCDAQPIGGPLKPFNPLLRAVYSRFGGWDPDRGIPEVMEEVFGNATVRHFNFRSLFIAASTKICQVGRTATHRALSVSCP